MGFFLSLFTSAITPLAYRLVQKLIAEAVASPDPLGALSVVTHQLSNHISDPAQLAAATAIAEDLVHFGELVVSKAILKPAA
jgi:hypothetical protein